METDPADAKESTPGQAQKLKVTKLTKETKESEKAEESERAEPLAVIEAAVSITTGPPIFKGEMGDLKPTTFAIGNRSEFSRKTNATPVFESTNWWCESDSDSDPDYF